MPLSIIERSAIGQGLTALIADQGSVNAAGTDNATPFNLEQLAAAVGLDPDELLDQVKSFGGEFVVRDQR